MVYLLMGLAVGHNGLLRCVNALDQEPVEVQYQEPGLGHDWKAGYSRS